MWNRPAVLRLSVTCWVFRRRSLVWQDLPLQLLAGRAEGLHKTWVLVKFNWTFICWDQAVLCSYRSVISPGCAGCFYRTLHGDIFVTVFHDLSNSVFDFVTGSCVSEAFNLMWMLCVDLKSSNCPVCIDSGQLWLRGRVGPPVPIDSTEGMWATFYEHHTLQNWAVPTLVNACVSTESTTAHFCIPQSSLCSTPTKDTCWAFI